MGNRIQRLDPLVASQIAAGEVVERPASVVKELVENALDAGARRIVVDFEESGLSLIRVSDDGCGIPSADASVAIERFATSKLRSADDLSSIATLGFRGEALPSIASCSRMTLETRVAEEPSGTSVCVEAGKILAQRDKGLPTGTTVTVENLFFNTPARLKFVKTRATERHATVDTVTRLALAWPEVSFTMRSGGNVVLRTSGQGLRNALADVFGPSDASSMVPVAPVEPQPGGVRVAGFIGLPSLYRRQRDRQVFSVNSRPVRNPQLGWAVDEGFLGLLPPKTYAVAVLDVKAAPEDVDVNVHPAKAEVKFRVERDLRSSVTAAVRHALRRAGFDSFGSEDGPHSVYPGHAEYRGYPGPGGAGRVQETSGPVNWELLRSDALAGTGPAGSPAIATRSLATQGGAGESELPAGWEYLGSIRDTYLVALTPAALLVIDKHALMESLTFASMLAGESGAQDLLVSEILHLDPREAAAYEDCEPSLEASGFSSRLVGDRTVMVTRVPLVRGKPLPPGALKDVLARLAGDDPKPGNIRSLDAIRMETAACHASIRAREPLTREEAVALLRDLASHPGARTCPHGRPVLREQPLSDMDEFFGRTSHTPGKRV